VLYDLGVFSELFNSRVCAFERSTSTLTPNA
jgi:hypothetical protein